MDSRRLLFLATLVAMASSVGCPSPAEEGNFNPRFFDIFVKEGAVFGDAYNPIPNECHDANGDLTELRFLVLQNAEGVLTVEDSNGDTQLSPFSASEIYLVGRADQDFAWISHASLSAAESLKDNEEFDISDPLRLGVSLFEPSAALGVEIEGRSPSIIDTRANCVELAEIDNSALIVGGVVDREIALVGNGQVCWISNPAADDTQVFLEKCWCREEFDTDIAEVELNGTPTGGESQCVVPKGEELTSPPLSQ